MVGGGAGADRGRSADEGTKRVAGGLRGGLAARCGWWGLLAVACVMAACVMAACSKGRPLTAAGLERPEAVHWEQAKRESPVHVELRRLTYELESDGPYTVTFKQRYRILKQMGVEHWSHTQAYWAPWYMKRPVLQATVVNRKPDGARAQLTLDPTTITEQPAYPEAPEIYSDSRLLRAPLPSVAVGSVVTEVIATTTHSPFLAKEHMHSVAIQTGVPQDKVERIIDAPSKLPVYFDAREAKVKRREVKEGGRTRITFSGGPYPALEPLEPLMPSSAPTWPSVDFATGKDWAPLAAAYAKLIDEKLEDIDFSSTVQQLVTADDTDFVKASKLYGWVKSRIRYVGIEFGDSGVIPHAPDQTVARAYGDCKDQATLLIGLLRAAGLPAHAALLRAGVGEDLNRKLAGMNVFDHVIVVVPTDPPLWLDPTGDHVRPGALPTADQGRLALVAARDTEGLVVTPRATPKTNTYRQATFQPSCQKPSSSSSARLTRRVTKKQDGSVQLHTTFTTGKARYSAREVKVFREALWRFNQSIVPYVEFDHPAKRLRDAGKPRAAVKLVQQEIAANSRDAAASLRLAELLLPYAREAAHDHARRAVQLGADGALREAERLALSGADLSSALEAASGTLSQRRQYEAAAKLVEAAIVGSNEASELQSRARVLRQLRKVDV